MRSYTTTAVALAAALLSSAINAQDGTPDATFGAGGRSFVSINPVEGEHLRPGALTVLPDGRLVFTGTRHKIDPVRPWEPHERAIIARLAPDGLPDPAFGDDPAFPGIVVLPELAPLTRIYAGEAIVPLADGRMLVAGSIDTFGGSFGFVVRTDAQGGLDGSFGNRGAVLLPGAALHALAIDSQGRLVVAGERVGGTPVYRGAVWRFSANGLPDVTFGDNGAVELVQRDGDTVLDRNSNATGLALLEDDRIVVAGQAQFPDPLLADNYDFSVARLTVDGAFDATFAGDGWAIYATPGGPVDWEGVTRLVHDRASGKVVAVGYYKPDDEHVHVALSRLLEDGSLDSSYGTPSNPGFSLLDIGAGAAYQYVYGAVAQPDGKLVLAVQQAAGGSGDFVVARVQAGGKRDPSFGTDGVTAVDLDPSGVYDMTVGVALQWGRPVAVGQSRRSATSPVIEASLVRLGNDPLFSDGFEQ
jgi:uncharacterized delta-60 repeat protein